MANENARRLRKEPTEAEKKFWARLCNGQLKGRKFRRQVPIGPYIADFVCHGEKLVVELDGGRHAERKDYDAARTARIEQDGYRVPRFWNNEVFENMDGVLERIVESFGRETE